MCEYIGGSSSCRLWMLRPVENLPRGDNPWEPWYDKAFGFIVRAVGETEARELAHREAGDENCGKTADTESPWLDVKYSTCGERLPSGKHGVVMRDFCAA